MDLVARFTLGVRVIVDNDASLIGVVTAVTFRQIRSPLYEISYIHNGDAKAAWIEESRIGLYG